MKLLTKAHENAALSQLEQENTAVAYDAACEGIVLLQNKGVLPLSKGKVALYGAGATHTVKGGTGSGEVNVRHSVNVLEGLENGGFTVTSKSWLERYGKAYDLARKKYLQNKRLRLFKMALGSVMDMLFDNFRYPAGPEITVEDVEISDTDSCVYVLCRQAGEGCDRRVVEGDFLPTQRELEDIRFCAAHYKNFVLVINCGGTMDLSACEKIENIGAIVYLCQAGQQGGNALADILSGKVTPSGHLSSTWAKHYSDIPFGEEYSYLSGDTENEYYKEGIFVGYRYFDSFEKEPAYPFGYGLSYTDFSMEMTDLKALGSQVQVCVKVTNTGARYAGKAVAQLYVSAPGGTLSKAYQSLAAFGKTGLLQPGEWESLTLSFDLRDHASYRGDLCFVLEKGGYILRLGEHSRATRPVGVVQLDADTVVSSHRPVCPAEESWEELEKKAYPEESNPGLPVVSVQITPRENRTSGTISSRAKEILRKMTDRDMAELVVGVGMYFGKTAFTLPGSVGNTTSRFWDRGLVNLPLCDGPAGLRLRKRSALTKRNTLHPVEMSMSMYDFLPQWTRKILCANPDKLPVYYQFTTAFPVATALAQSWNTALLQRIGSAVQREMERYGCVYWLAPAVNLHRNPLCGRNFEYFSEDPYLTGTMAGAIIGAVQSKPGFYATVKHLACNNQEENRNFSNSHISQKALRELYLRPFQMAVESGVKAVMTSYNLVNGERTANSRDLCTRLLRQEWGFEGLVMTDWYATNPGRGKNELCIACGNDLIMPGSNSAKKQLLRAVKKGTLERAQLALCAGRVIDAILQSQLQKEFFPSDTWHSRHSS